MEDIDGGVIQMEAGSDSTSNGPDSVHTRTYTVGSSTLKTMCVCVCGAQRAHTHTNCLGVSTRLLE